MALEDRSKLVEGVRLVATVKGQRYGAVAVKPENEEDGDEFGLNYRVTEGGQGIDTDKLFTSISGVGSAAFGRRVSGFGWWSFEGEEKPPREKKEKAPKEPKEKKERAPRASRNSGPTASRKGKFSITAHGNQRDLEEGQKRYFCSECMEGFVADDLGKGKTPDVCPNGHSKSKVVAPAADAEEPVAQAEEEVEDLFAADPA